MKVQRFFALVLCMALFALHSEAALVWNTNGTFRQVITTTGSVTTPQEGYSQCTAANITLGAAERSTDGGTTWESYSGNVFSAAVYVRAQIIGGASDGTVVVSGQMLQQGQSSTAQYSNYSGATGILWTLYVGSWGGDEPYYATLWTSSGGSSSYLPQRRLSWTVTNSNQPSATSNNSETWAIFRLEGTTPTGIAFASKVLQPGQSATLEIYVAQGDPYNYAPARVDYALSAQTYGGFPISGTAFPLNPDGTTNYSSDPLFTYLEGALPAAGSVGATGNYANATQVTQIPSGTSAPGSNNQTPIVTTPQPVGGGNTVSITPGTGGTTTSTDAGTATAFQQGANGIINAVNTVGAATRQAVDRTTAAVNAGNAADAASRQAEANARQGIESEASESAIANAVAQRDAQLAGKDTQAAALFSSVNGGMTAQKVTPTISMGDSSAWIIHLDVLGDLDINPFTNAWVQQKLPFLNWLVAFFRVAVVWSSQVVFYRWLANTIRENAIAFMHTPSPPPTVIENIASSNPFTAILGKLGAVFSSLFLAVLILSSLSTILSVMTTWGTISSLVSSISDGTNFISSVVTGLGATSGYLGRIVYFVTAYIPVSALLGIGANYVLIETGLVATMPVLVFSMRIRRW